jgi:muramoyltetrapeptide carboxypeptidase
MDFAPVPRLRPGDPVAVVAPAGMPRAPDLRRGLDLLAARYEVLTARDLLALEPHGPLAGTDDARAAELRWAIAHPRAKCIFAARGGYGSARVVDGALLDALVSNPRLVVVFSDLTVLLCGALSRSLRAVHGPMVCQLGTEGREGLFDLLHPLLEVAAPPPPSRSLETLVAGMARGPLVGGNITILSHLVGTGLLPTFQGAILALEDVGERPYRIDRCLVHLEMAGALDGVAGLVFGDLVECEPQGTDWTAREVVTAFCRRIGVPAVIGLPMGHGAWNVPLPLGARVELAATDGVLSFLEPVVTEDTHPPSPSGRGPG